MVSGKWSGFFKWKSKCVEQFVSFFVVSGIRLNGYLKAVYLAYVFRVYFREYDMLFNADGIIAVPVKRFFGYSAEVADAGENHVNQFV